MRDFGHIRLWDGDLCICIFFVQDGIFSLAIDCGSLLHLADLACCWSHKRVVFLIQSPKKINQVIFS